ncbi:MAG: alpha/beta fold hydrolase [Puniceicoccales bacterium]|jgi:haloalkane dehalogenase|nr:alpha/beta fold hydrolase [Puniceicoccales bacterium]
MSKKDDTFSKLYPFTSQFSEIDSDRNRVHYIEVGKGETVLFLHGFPTWSFMYRNLILELASDFRCVALDNLGYGFSDKPLRYKYTIKKHIENAIKFAENMHFKKFHLVMHDFGVGIGLALAERWPERISSMAFLNSSCFKHPKLPFSITLMKIPIISTILTRCTNLLQSIFLHIGMNFLTEDVKRGYLKPYDSFLSRVAISDGLADIPLFPDNPSLETYYDIEGKAFILSNKKMKFFWADLDFFHNFTSLKRWAKILPNALLKRYEQDGHFLLEDSPEARHDIRAFLLKHRDINRSLFK